MSPTLNHLLKCTSRSFYLSIRWLPAEMRPGIGIGYLFARISDTLADTAAAPVAVRVALLERFRDLALTESTPDRAFLTAVESDFLPHQTHEGERALLAVASLTEAFAALNALPESEQEAVREVLREIIAGQRWDLEFFEGAAAVTEDATLLRYTYQVAGCVGEFWTRIGEITRGERFAPAHEIGELMQRGKHYGQALQLINILRDIPEDRANGREYLPGDRDRWIAQAHDFLDDGERYVRQIRGFRVRFATALPYLIGRETLALLARPEAEDTKVKVSRAVVRRCLVRAAKLGLQRPR